MQVLKRSITICILVILLVGCSTGSEEVETGMIVAMEDERILVIPEATNEDINELSTQEMIDQYENAIWLTVSLGDNSEELEIGMEIKVWYDAMNTSVPATGKANIIEIQ